jgi:hypothetical protein
MWIHHHLAMRQGTAPANHVRTGHGSVHGHAAVIGHVMTSHRLMTGPVVLVHRGAVLIASSLVRLSERWRSGHAQRNCRCKIDAMFHQFVLSPHPSACVVKRSHEQWSCPELPRFSIPYRCGRADRDSVRSRHLHHRSWLPRCRAQRPGREAPDWPLGSWCRLQDRDIRWRVCGMRPSLTSRQ